MLYISSILTLPYSYLYVLLIKDSNFGDVEKITLFFLRSMYIFVNKQSHWK